MATKIDDALNVVASGSVRRLESALRGCAVSYVVICLYVYKFPIS